MNKLVVNERVGAVVELLIVTDGVITRSINLDTTECPNYMSIVASVNAGEMTVADLERGQYALDGAPRI